MSKSNTIPAAAQGTDPEKAARVQAEQVRLMDLFAGADPNKLDFIRDAVQQVAWLGISILELQADIDANGPVIPFQNGRNQTGMQANPACKTLKDFQTLYNAQFRALLPVLPDNQQTRGNALLRMEFESRLKTPEEIASEERAEEEKRKRINAEIAAAQKRLDEMHAKSRQSRI